MTLKQRTDVDIHSSELQRARLIALIEESVTQLAAAGDHEGFTARADG
jgi:hypothetical protein